MTFTSTNTRKRKRKRPKKAGAKSAPSVLEETLALQIRALKLPPPVREYIFHPVRKWRFDFAWPEFLLACEVEGGTATGGRHVTPAGFRADCDKYAAAMLLRWDVYRCTGAMVRSGAAVETIQQLLAIKEQPP